VTIRLFAVIHVINNIFLEKVGIRAQRASMLILCIIMCQVLENIILIATAVVFLFFSFAFSNQSINQSLLLCHYLLRLLYSYQL